MVRFFLSRPRRTSEVLPPGHRPRVQKASRIPTTTTFRSRHVGQDGLHRLSQSYEHVGALLRCHVNDVLCIGHSRVAITPARIWQRHHGVGSFRMAIRSMVPPSIADGSDPQFDRFRRPAPDFRGTLRLTGEPPQARPARGSANPRRARGPHPRRRTKSRPRNPADVPAGATDLSERSVRAHRAGPPRRDPVVKAVSPARRRGRRRHAHLGEQRVFSRCEHVGFDGDPHLSFS